MKDFFRNIKMVLGLLLRNTQAQYDAGAAFLEMGGKDNHLKAFQYISKAAEKSHPKAQGLLGGMYYHGTGVKQDYGKAIEWFKKSSQQGYPLAQVALGGIYEAGHGVPKDQHKAFTLYFSAGNQGLIKAQMLLVRLWGEYQTNSEEKINILVLMSLAADYVQGIYTAFYASKKEYLALGENAPEDSKKVYLEALFFVLWDIDVMLHFCKQTTSVRHSFFDFALKSISVSYPDFDFKRIKTTAIERLAEYGAWESKVKGKIGSPSDPIASHLMANLDFALLKNDFRKVNHKTLPLTSASEYFIFALQVFLTNAWLRGTVMELCSDSEDFSEIKSSDFIVKLKKAKEDENKITTTQNKTA